VIGSESKSLTLAVAEMVVLVLAEDGESCTLDTTGRVLATITDAEVLVVVIPKLFIATTQHSMVSFTLVALEETENVVPVDAV
jgi:hypothetical protein